MELNSSREIICPKHLEGIVYFAIFADEKRSFQNRIQMRNLAYLIILFLAFYPTKGLAQEQVFQGRVLDAETGEPLPYVNISIGKGQGTLTNIEGDFKLTIGEEDVVVFSYVGYDKQKIKADKLSEVIRLKPYSTTMKEVTVLPVDYDKVLKRTIDNLKDDFRNQGEWFRRYFFRTMIEKGEESYIAEAFVKAFSVVNIRSAEIISGLEGYDKEASKGKLNVQSSNIHKLIEVGPRTVDSPFWSNSTKPLQHYTFTRHYYDMKCQNIYSEEGEVLYKIEFTMNEKVKSEYTVKPYITGIAYIDAETCKLLRFDGSCNNYYMYTGLLPYYTTIDFQLEYDYSQGVASVSHLAISGCNEFLFYRALLFAIEENKVSKKRIKGSGYNIVTALAEAGFDESLWSKYDIVKRTKEEERIAFGK